MQRAAVRCFDIESKPVNRTLSGRGGYSRDRYLLMLQMRVGFLITCNVHYESLKKGYHLGYVGSLVYSLIKCQSIISDTTAILQSYFENNRMWSQMLHYKKQALWKLNHQALENHHYSLLFLFFDDTLNSFKWSLDKTIQPWMSDLFLWICDLFTSKHINHH